MLLQHGESKDIESYELYEELQLLTPYTPDSVRDANHLIEYIIKNELQDLYSNVYIAIRIMLIMPVSTASAERSFSKLKIIKNFEEKYEARATVCFRNTINRSRVSFKNQLQILITYL